MTWALQFPYDLNGLLSWLLTQWSEFKSSFATKKMRKNPMCHVCIASGGGFAECMQRVIEMESVCLLVCLFVCLFVLSE